MNEQRNAVIKWPFQDFLEHFLYSFVYFPTTNWQRAFNPQFYFGCNLEDTEVEQHVLSKVGSYGKQLSKVLDVLVARVLPDTLTPQERLVIASFHDLVRRTDQAVAEQRGPSVKGITQSDIIRMIEGLRALEKTDPALHRAFVQQMGGAVPLITMAQDARTS